VTDEPTAAGRSPFRVGPAFTTLADDDELRFRDEIEPALRGDRVEDWLARKELVPKLEAVLRNAELAPRGVVVDLGAGSCWLGAALARHAEVERVLCVEFSRRRLEELAPAAIAALGAPAEKVERVLADFYAPGIPAGTADLVTTDAAFHHAADPARLARVAFELLRPGGAVLLHREPTLALLRRTRDHGIEDEHGAFEHEYTARGYLRFLRDAGFAQARKVPAPGGVRGLRARALLRPPLSWLNGIAFAEYAYVARRPPIP
jgi:SAM-dependent methyltransferase